MENYRPKASVPIGAQPVLHRPCSATLSKFHDSVNFSLQGINPLYSNPKTHHDENDPRSKARNNFMYMLKKKTYVDETLFTSHNPKVIRTQNDDSQDSLLSNKTHLTHLQMSNMTPLIHNPPPSRPISSVSSNRPSSARMNQQQQQQQQQDQNMDVRKSSANFNKQKPWKP